MLSTFHSLLHHGNTHTCRHTVQPTQPQFNLCCFTTGILHSMSRRVPRAQLIIIIYFFADVIISIVLHSAVFKAKMIHKVCIHFVLFKQICIENCDYVARIQLLNICSIAIIKCNKTQLYPQLTSSYLLHKFKLSGHFIRY